MGLRDVHVFVRGVGSGRDGAVRALHAQGLNVLTIKDVTPIPHNGPRAPKPRRV
jgi:small subunit ribosomal protein S11